MSGIVRILTFSPRLTVAVCIMLFGGIGGTLSGNKADAPKSPNAWSKQNSGGAYSAQKRYDDGWGGSTSASNARDNGRSGVTTREVWVDRDGVVHEKEDMKAIDPDAFE